MVEVLDAVVISGSITILLLILVLAFFLTCSLVFLVMFCSIHFLIRRKKRKILNPNRSAQQAQSADVQQTAGLAESPVSQSQPSEYAEEYPPVEDMAELPGVVADVAAAPVIMHPMSYRGDFTPPESPTPAEPVKKAVPKRDEADDIRPGVVVSDAVAQPHPEEIKPASPGPAAKRSVRFGDELVAETVTEDAVAQPHPEEIKPASPGPAAKQPVRFGDELVAEVVTDNAMPRGPRLDEIRPSSPNPAAKRPVNFGDELVAEAVTDDHMPVDDDVDEIRASPSPAHPMSFVDDLETAAADSRSAVKSAVQMDGSHDVGAIRPGVVVSDAVSHAQPGEIRPDSPGPAAKQPVRFGDELVAEVVTDNAMPRGPRLDEIRPSSPNPAAKSDSAEFSSAVRSTVQTAQMDGMRDMGAIRPGVVVSDAVSHAQPGEIRPDSPGPAAKQPVRFGDELVAEVVTDNAMPRGPRLDEIRPSSPNPAAKSDSAEFSSAVRSTVQTAQMDGMRDMGAIRPGVVVSDAVSHAQPGEIRPDSPGPAAKQPVRFGDELVAEVVTDNAMPRGPRLDEIRPSSPNPAAKSDSAEFSSAVRSTVQTAQMDGMRDMGAIRPGVVVSDAVSHAQPGEIRPDSPGPAAKQPVRFGDELVAEVVTDNAMPRGPRLDEIRPSSPNPAAKSDSAEFSSAVRSTVQTAQMDGMRDMGAIRPGVVVSDAVSHAQPGEIRPDSPGPAAKQPVRFGDELVAEVVTDNAMPRGPRLDEIRPSSPNPAAKSDSAEFSSAVRSTVQTAQMDGMRDMGAIRPGVVVSDAVSHAQPGEIRPDSPGPAAKQPVRFGDELVAEVVTDNAMPRGPRLDEIRPSSPNPAAKSDSAEFSSAVRSTVQTAQMDGMRDMGAIRPGVVVSDAVSHAQPGEIRPDSPGPAAKQPVRFGDELVAEVVTDNAMPRGPRLDEIRPSSPNPAAKRPVNFGDELVAEAVTDDHMPVDDDVDEIRASPSPAHPMSFVDDLETAAADSRSAVKSAVQMDGSHDVGAIRPGVVVSDAVSHAQPGEIRPDSPGPAAKQPVRFGDELVAEVVTDNAMPRGPRLDEIRPSSPNPAAKSDSAEFSSAVRSTVQTAQMDGMRDMGAIRPGVVVSDAVSHAQPGEIRPDSPGPAAKQPVRFGDELVAEVVTDNAMPRGPRLDEIRPSSPNPAAKSDSAEFSSAVRSTVQTAQMDGMRDMGAIRPGVVVSDAVSHAQPGEIRPDSPGPAAKQPVRFGDELVAEVVTDNAMPRGPRLDEIRPSSPNPAAKSDSAEFSSAVRSTVQTAQMDGMRDMGAIRPGVVVSDAVSHAQPGEIRPDSPGPAAKQPVRFGDELVAEVVTDNAMPRGPRLDEIRPSSPNPAAKSDSAEFSSAVRSTVQTAQMDGMRDMGAIRPGVVVSDAVSHAQPGEIRPDSPGPAAKQPVRFGDELVAEVVTDNAMPRGPRLDEIRPSSPNPAAKSDSAEFSSAVRSTVQTAQMDGMRDMGAIRPGVVVSDAVSHAQPGEIRPDSPGPAAKQPVRFGDELVAEVVTDNAMPRGPRLDEIRPSSPNPAAKSDSAEFSSAVRSTVQTAQMDGMRDMGAIRPGVVVSDAVSHAQPGEIRPDSPGPAAKQPVRFGDELVAEVVTDNAMPRGPRLDEIRPSSPNPAAKSDSAEFSSAVRSTVQTAQMDGMRDMGAIRPGVVVSDAVSHAQPGEIRPDSPALATKVDSDVPSVRPTVQAAQMDGTRPVKAIRPGGVVVTSAVSDSPKLDEIRPDSPSPAEKQPVSFGSEVVPGVIETDEMMPTSRLDEIRPASPKETGPPALDFGTAVRPTVAVIMDAKGDEEPTKPTVFGEPRTIGETVARPTSWTTASIPRPAPTRTQPEPANVIVRPARDSMASSASQSAFTGHSAFIQIGRKPARDIAEMGTVDVEPVEPTRVGSPRESDVDDEQEDASPALSHQYTNDEAFISKPRLSSEAMSPRASPELSMRPVLATDVQPAWMEAPRPSQQALKVSQTTVPRGEAAEAKPIRNTIRVSSSDISPTARARPIDRAVRVSQPVLDMTVSSAPAPMAKSVRVSQAVFDLAAPPAEDLSGPIGHSVRVSQPVLDIETQPGEAISGPIGHSVRVSQPVLDGPLPIASADIPMSSPVELAQSMPPSTSVSRIHTPGPAAVVSAVNGRHPALVGGPRTIRNPSVSASMRGASVLADRPTRMYTGQPVKASTMASPRPLRSLQGAHGLVDARIPSVPDLHAPAADLEAPRDLEATAESTLPEAIAIDRSEDSEPEPLIPESDSSPQEPDFSVTVTQSIDMPHPDLVVLQPRVPRARKLLEMEGHPRHEIRVPSPTRPRPLQSAMKQRDESEITIPNPPRRVRIQTTKLPSARVEIEQHKMPEGMDRPRTAPGLNAFVAPASRDAQMVAMAVHSENIRSQPPSVWPSRAVTPMSTRAESVVARAPEYYPTEELPLDEPDDLQDRWAAMKASSAAATPQSQAPATPAPPSPEADEAVSRPMSTEPTEILVPSLSASLKGPNAKEEPTPTIPEPEEADADDESEPVALPPSPPMTEVKQVSTHDTVKGLLRKPAPRGRRLTERQWSTPSGVARMPSMPNSVLDRVRGILGSPM
ncbi:hypothetical protein J8273_5679 [Carpediemonas membranifera]|uniref:Uncharacterized protein n=1 Tax=Carpediemonas membranifera TaxID=201153 RepID=A0A8J6B4R0_9EUKA|nr:hypothetical protein J8273_5679 [Carpediemonas membranifera]|eukprot:KAG9392969.1 hypothetical protein J8273_5679 [Carpediemonas membranifera]